MKLTTDQLTATRNTIQFLNQTELVSTPIPPDNKAYSHVKKPVFNIGKSASVRLSLIETAVEAPLKTWDKEYQEAMAVFAPAHEVREEKLKAVPAGPAGDEARKAIEDEFQAKVKDYNDALNDLSKIEHELPDTLKFDVNLFRDSGATIPTECWRALAPFLTGLENVK